MPATYRSRKARLAAISAKLRRDGKSWADVATYLADTEHERPLVAMRLAHGLSQSEVSDQWNALYPDSPITFKMLSYWEVWPHGRGHQPSLTSLGRLARIYDCAVGDLVDDETLAVLSGGGKAPPRGERLTRPRTSPATPVLGITTPGTLTPETATNLPVPSLGLPLSWETLGSISGLPEGEEADIVLRRAFLLGMSVASLGSTGQSLTSETARHGLNLAIEQRATVDLADWHEIVREHGLLCMTHTPAELREVLLVDLLGLETTLALCQDEATRRELYKVGALLAHYMAQTVGDLGSRREAWRWWRTAKQAADASGDLQVMRYIRGREAIRAIYEERPPELILQRIAEADELPVSGPVSSAPSLLAARAQCLALLGRAEDAETALHVLRETFSALPSTITSNRDGYYGAYPEERVRFAESFVYSHLGNASAATAAQEHALALYPSISLRGPVQIELQRALCLCQRTRQDPQWRT